MVAGAALPGTLGRCEDEGVTEHELPPDPDLDDLPDEIAPSGR